MKLLPVKMPQKALSERWEYKTIVKILRDYLLGFCCCCCRHCLFLVLNKKATIRANFFLFHFFKLSLFALAMFLLPESPA